MARLDELLARNLPCSRAHARQLVTSGQVRTADGNPIADPRSEAPSQVILGGQMLRLLERAYLVMNKPAGVVTALDDQRHPTAYSLLRDAPLFPELRPVGRLDLDSVGLLLWTNDGQWVQRLTHPKRKVPRTYHAALARPHHPLPPGLVLDDGHRPTITGLDPLAIPHPSLPRPADATTLVTITIVGGAYHEVRRIFAALGSHVVALCRVGFGRLSLPTDLELGAYRELSVDDV